MKDFFIRIRNATISFLYKRVLKPIYFLMDPEKVHDRMTSFGSSLGKSSVTRKTASFNFGYKNKMLEQDILGIHFPNPIGLAAGFDKNARLTQILPSVGFGFMEVGSITGEPCEGNPKPRLWRMKKSKSLMVYYGLLNDGCEAIADRLRNLKFRIPVGISVAKTNSPNTVETEAGVADYAKAFNEFRDIGAYTTINISCPNAYGGEPFTDPDKLDRLLTETDKVQTSKPVFLKISPDLDKPLLDRLIEIAQRHKINGFICSNLTKKRDNPQITDAIVPDMGGMSGKIQEELSTAQIKYVYQKTNGKYIIIGCGGVFNAKDAYKKIKAGASLIQMITGMIYEGPQVISAINHGLVKLLKKDGYSNISEAVGKENQ